MSELPLYRRVLGDRFSQLCAPVQALHTATRGFEVTGRCDIERGSSWLANRLADFVGMPPAGKDVPLRFHIAKEAERERWTRDFAGHRFHSVLWQQGELVHERLGPVELAFRLEIEQGALRMVLQKGWLLGLLRLPRFCLPAVSTREFGSGAQYQFDVKVDWPLLGQVVRYQGTLDMGSAKTVR
jgi:hypothetical protein